MYATRTSTRVPPRSQYRKEVQAVKDTDVIKFIQDLGHHRLIELSRAEIFDQTVATWLPF